MGLPTLFSKPMYFLQPCVLFIFRLWKWDVKEFKVLVEK